MYVYIFYISLTKNHAIESQSPHTFPLRSMMCKGEGDLLTEDDDWFEERYNEFFGWHEKGANVAIDETALKITPPCILHIFHMLSHNIPFN